MIERFHDFFSLPISFIIFISVIFSAVIFVFYPVLFGNTTIKFDLRVEKMNFKISKNFKTCELIFNREILISTYSEGLLDENTGFTLPGSENRTIDGIRKD